MRRVTLLLGVLGVLGLLGAALGLAAAPARAANVQIDVGDDYFSPARVAVKPGDTVTWVNPGSGEAHNVVFNDGSFTAPGVPSTTWTVMRTFMTPGKYTYHCQVHGAAMSGVVYVNAAGALPPLVSLAVSPNPAQTGQTVNFDASASTDSSGIVDYRWDLDGSGSFATDTGSTPTVSHSYSSPTSVIVTVRVTDMLGLSDERSVSLVVNSQPPPPPPPRPPPSVTGFAASHRIFRVGKASMPAPGKAMKRAALGTTFRFKLSQAATVKIDLRQLLPGRRQGTSCVKSTGKVKPAQMCTRAVSRGTLTRSSQVGPNSVVFSGRIGNKALTPGHYQAVLTATGATGVASATKTLTFKVVRA